MNFWKERRVFVTGGAGFLGTALTQQLVAHGARVTCLIRDWVPEAPYFSSPLLRQVNVVRGEVEQYPVLERALNEYEIETVFHLAAQPLVGVANRNPLATFETNIKGTWNLLEAARRNTCVKRVVVASSDKAYGDHKVLPYDEGFSLQGRHPYDVSKSCADLISLTYHQTYGLPVSITRCGNLYGPGDINFSRLVPGTIRSVLAGERPLIRSDGSPKRDYVFIDDIVDAYLTLAEQMERAAVRGQAYNFGTGTPLSVLELTQAILAAAGRADLPPVILNDARGEIVHQYLDSTRARRELGWAPKGSVAERLATTVAWYRQYLARPLEEGARVG